ncbi:MAG: hypothetical protein MZW92_14515 [Comamonadaceae bacterium]|nr:hypothetical protein [Comamonadaceae bacterium]
MSSTATPAGADAAEPAMGVSGRLARAFQAQRADAAAGAGGAAARPVRGAGDAARGRAADQRHDGQRADPVPRRQRRPTCRTWSRGPAEQVLSADRTASSTPIRSRAPAWRC